jgi:hypothetical protein
MTGTSVITSSAVNIQFMDNVGVQLNFSGSPVGTFQVQVSADYAFDEIGNVTVENSGNWTPVTLSYLLGGTLTFATSVPTSQGSPIYLDLNQLSAPWLRVVYTNSSGSGTLNCFVTGKEI